MESKILKVEEIAYDELTNATVGVHVLENGTKYIATKIDDSGIMPYKIYLKNLTINDKKQLEPYMGKNANIYIYSDNEKYNLNKKLNISNSERSRNPMKLIEDYILG
jgi:hypothetical protein